MFIGVSAVQSESKIRLTPNMLKRIASEYERLDLVNN